MSTRGFNQLRLRGDRREPGQQRGTAEPCRELTGEVDQHAKEMNALSGAAVAYIYIRDEVGCPLGRTTRSRVAVTQPAPATTRAKAPVEPVGRASSTRSAGGPPLSSVPKTKDKQTAGTGVIGTSSVQAAYGRMCRRRFDPVVESSPAPTTMRDEEEKMVEDATAGPLPVEDPPSFAPQGFMFQGLQGLSTFQFVPLTPCSADSFLRPSFSFPPVPSLDLESTVEPSSFPPQDLPLDPLPHTSPTPAPQQAPLSPQEPEHNVPYFRLQMSLETEKLTGLSQLWECRVEDQSIPEEMEPVGRASSTRSAGSLDSL
ncbi:hypothetical protein NHX12_024589 [Muraenolepis orangiensis]|uniref:Uncharacterized protein n=1 Tax=Muraenolepis orangiensis TaxID=630683 RepID=A0A9Q0EJN2_9TELE|nr:hypothetical protein NHX12_024589 [Muraenolepis orangiensis]